MYRTYWTYPGTINHLINRFISNQLESIYTDDTSSSKNWYQTTIVDWHNLLNNRLANSQLRRLLFWSYTQNFTSPSSLSLCHHCQRDCNLVHYLLNCPAHPMYWRRLNDHLLPEDNKLPDYHLAALIVRKSTFSPDMITTLLLKDPYKHYHQQ